jgi:hypothetical protein
MADSAWIRLPDDELARVMKCCEWRTDELSEMTESAEMTELAKMAESAEMTESAEMAALAKTAELADENKPLKANCWRTAVGFYTRWITCVCQGFIYTIVSPELRATGDNR